MAIEKYYSPNAVMKMLGISRTTLWRLTKDGEISAEWVGSRKRYSESAILNHLKRKNQKEVEYSEKVHKTI